MSSFHEIPQWNVKCTRKEEQKKKEKNSHLSESRYDTRHTLGEMHFVAAFYGAIFELWSSYKFDKYKFDPKISI